MSRSWRFPLRLVPVLHILALAVLAVTVLPIEAEPPPFEPWLEKLEALLDSGSAEEALEGYREILELAAAAGDRRAVGAAEQGLGFALVSLGRAPDALPHLRRALAARRGLDHPLDLAESLVGNAAAEAILGNLDASNVLLEEGLEIARSVDASRRKGEVLAGAATVHMGVGRPRQALELYREALEVLEAGEGRSVVGEIHLKVGGLLEGLGETAEALAAYDAALEAAGELSDLESQAVRLTRRGNLLWELGRLDESVRDFEEAKELARQTPGLDDDQPVLEVLGGLYFLTGRLDDAEMVIGEGLRAARQLDRPDSELQLLLTLAQWRSTHGSYREALSILADAQRLAERRGEPDGVAMVHNVRGEIFRRLGDSERSLRERDRAAKLSDDGLTRTLSWNSSALIHLGEDRFTEAVVDFKRALESSRSEEAPLLEGRILANLGLAYLLQDRVEDAERTFAEALEIARRYGDRMLEGQTLIFLGAVHEERQAYERAVEFHQRALRIWGRSGFQEGRLLALTALGSTLAESGEDRRAIEAFARAVALLEEMQEDLKPLDLGRGFARHTADAYGNIIQLLARNGDVADAFAYAERSRARVWARRFGLAPERRGTSAAIDPVGISEVRALLGGTTTLVAYFLAEDSWIEETSWAWVIDAEIAQLIPLPADPSEVRRDVVYLRDRIAERSSDLFQEGDDVAGRLHRALIAPLTPYIRHADVVLIPHRVLHLLPFAALRDETTGRYLMGDYSLHQVPSARALRDAVARRNAYEGRWLGFADADGSLPHATVEGEAIQRLIGGGLRAGARATESALRSAAREVDVLHLAVHGVHDRSDPLASHLALALEDAGADAQYAQRDGRLEVREILELDLDTADLVVLSACETGLGHEVGDEFLGLTRAFLLAGSPAVVTTLWPIDDQATRALMESFYRSLREGLTAARALRAAQREISRREAWSSPYYWAGFILSGDSHAIFRSIP